MAKKKTIDNSPDRFVEGYERPKVPGRRKENWFEHYVDSTVDELRNASREQIEATLVKVQKKKKFKKRVGSMNAALFESTVRQRLQQEREDS